MVTYHLYFHF